MKSYKDGRNTGLDSPAMGDKPKRSKGKIVLYSFLVLLVLSVIGAAFGSKTKTTSSPSNAGASQQDNVTTTTQAPAAPWYPSGYKEFSDGIAIQWTNESCGEGMGYCWHAEVIARDGCPTALYAEIQVQDASGAAIGMTNDLLGSVSPMQVGKLTFTTFDDNAKRAKLTTINCY